MMLRYRLVELLADGHFRSGEWLGRELGVSRAAVWKHVRALSDLGLDIHAVRGQGYRLAAQFQPLCLERVRAALPATVAARLASIELFQEIDSTSDYLKRAPSLGASGQGRACMAEWQSAGRGRRGRRWVSPYGSSLYLSLGWQLGSAALQSGGLSLVVAIAVLRALRSCGVEGVGLKWPNDIFYQGRKLAGILLDVSGESAGPFQVVIGIGVNCRLPASAARDIDQPWADLSQSGVSVDRNRLAGMILEALIQALDTFTRDGLAAFAAEWERFDLIAGRSVELQHDHEHRIAGIARGIDSHGALLIDQDGDTRSFHAGEVSVRLV
jgi:BirA family biotin operon repressor/biotin-[acetyl-CoA-carboxylase] ligase